MHDLVGTRPSDDSGRKRSIAELQETSRLLSAAGTSRHLPSRQGQGTDTMSLRTQHGAVEARRHSAPAAHFVSNRLPVH